jgi:hypothetical protein
MSIEDSQFHLGTILFQGPGLTNTVRTAGSLTVMLENQPLTVIIFRGRLAQRRTNIVYPRRDDDRMKITPLRAFRTVGIEFCGSDIDTIVDAVGQAATFVEVGMAAQPLLDYFRKSFSVVPS